MATRHFFSLTRGIRQGCPLSGLLFVIGLDLLGRAIKNHNLIKGITLGNHEIKTTMYADNTTVFLSDTESISHLLKLLSQFKVVSGLELSQYLQNRSHVAWQVEKQIRHSF